MPTGDPGKRTALETRTAKKMGDLLNLRGLMSLRDSRSLRDRLNPRSVQEATCLRAAAREAVRVGAGAAVQPTPALRLRRVAAIRNWTGRDRSEWPTDSRRRVEAFAFRQVSHVELAPDLPVVTVGIFDAADTPSMPLSHLMHSARPGGARLRKYSVRVGNGENHARTDTVERLWAEIPVLWRLIAYPELRVAHGESRDDPAAAFEPVEFTGIESELVKLDSLDAVPHQQPGREG